MFTLGLQAGDTLSKSALFPESVNLGDTVVELSTTAHHGNETKAENGLSPGVEALSTAQHEQKERLLEETVSSHPDSKDSGDQVQYDPTHIEGTTVVRLTDDIGINTNSEVSRKSGAKGVEKQHHRLKNLLEEEHQAEQPNGGPVEAEAVPSPKTSPLLKRIIERVRPSPPNVGSSKDSSKDGSSQSEVKARRSVFSCQCFSPVN